MNGWPVLPRGVGTAALWLSLTTGLAGCGSTGPPSPDPVLRGVASDAPDHFLVAGGEGSVEPSGDGICRSPMVDPRDGVHLKLVRSSGGQGDYTVPPGRYGVGEDEILRVDCSSGRPVGIYGRPK